MILAGDIGGTNTRLAFFEGTSDRLQPSSHRDLSQPRVCRAGRNRSQVSRHSQACRGGRLFRIAWRGGERPRRNNQLALGGGGAPHGRGTGHQARPTHQRSLRQRARDRAAGRVGFRGAESRRSASGGKSRPDFGRYWVWARRVCSPTSRAAIIHFPPKAATPISRRATIWRSSCCATCWAASNTSATNACCPGRGSTTSINFCATPGRGEEPAWLAEQIAHGDPSAAISKSALEGTSEICVQALDMFVSLYGAEAGNLALKMLATGGVYVGGGIAPKIIRKLSGPAFMKSFTAKGRKSGELKDIPVRVITNDKTALLGAGRVAAMSLARP